MRNRLYLVAGLALSAMVSAELPVQAQKRVRPQTPRGYRPPFQSQPDQLERRLAQLEARRRNILMEFQVNSPEVRAIERQIREVRRELQRQPKTPRPNFWRPEFQLVSSR